MDDAHPGEAFIGSWLVSTQVGGQPSVLERTDINVLSADAMMALLADGTVIASVSPSYPASEAISADVLQVGTAYGSWVVSAESGISVRCAALLRTERGEPVATVYLDAALVLDAEQDTLSGVYTVFSHLSRAWTGNLPALDGSVQAWRVGLPVGFE